MSVELGIPSDLDEACALVCGMTSRVRKIDVGQLGGRCFMLRVGLGLEAEMIRGADRGLKERLGVLAYGFAAVRALRTPTTSCYRLTLDGKSVESEGITCIVANAGGLGKGRLSLAPTIEVSDGLLDVIVLRRADLSSLLVVSARIVAGRQDAERLKHWQVREVTVESDPPQPVQLDGESLDVQEIEAKVLPGAVRVIVPAAPAP
jgi:diacylglycerol kinase family enzyme